MRTRCETKGTGCRMPSFEISFEDGAVTCVLRLAGDIDTSVVPELKKALETVLVRGCTSVILDFTHVIYADSSALELLVWLDHRLSPVNGKLILAGASRDVTRILVLSGLATVAASIAMSVNVAAALEGLGLEAAPSEQLWRESIEMPADVHELAGVRELVCRLVTPLEFPESAVFDIKVALGEALANAVRHGSPCGVSGVVGVEVSAYSDRVVIEVTDSGGGFDGKAECSNDVYASGGRGIMFMRALMDRVEFDTPESGGTTVRLVKHRQASAVVGRDDTTHRGSLRIQWGGR